ncbi:MAG: hypothetical protein FJX68_05690 [Alphaproteobacteria bacterium]|nr:hypothetical protein [Alphaproteobacteria bacterium]
MSMPVGWRRGRLIERVMCDLPGDPAPMGGAAACAGELAALARLAADGLVAIAGDRVLVSEAGRPFCRLVAQAFDAHAARAPQRHSAAVSPTGVVKT